MSVIRLSRRAFIAHVAAAGAGLCAAACAPKGGGETAEPTARPQIAPTTAPESSPAVPPAPSEPVKVQLIDMLDPGEDVVMDACLGAYNENENIEVIMEVLPWDGYAEKVVTMVAGGAAPDISFMHTTWLSLFAEQETILPLDAFVDRDADFGIDDIFETIAGYFFYGGKRYGVPLTSWPTVTYYNKTLFDELGVTYPSEFMDGLENASDQWTWDKALQIALPLTQGEGVDRTFGISGDYGAVPTSLAHLCQIIFSYGGQVWSDDLKTTGLCEAPALEAITFQSQLITQHHVAPIPAEVEGIPEGVNGGRYGMWMWNRSEVLGFANVEFELGMAAFPRGPKGRVLRDSPKTYALLSSTKVAEQAWDFYKWMAGPQPGVLGGQEYQFKSQRTIPTRKSLMDSPLFAEGLLPWESLEVYQDAATRVDPLEFPARFSEIDAVYREQWDRIVLGQATVEEAMQEFCTRANEMLA